MKKFTLFSFLVFLAFNYLNAQIYEFSVSNETYVPLEKSISVTNGEIFDEIDFSVPIGFDFQLYDKLIDSLYIFDGTLTIIDVPDIDKDTVIFSAALPILANVVDLGYNIEESLSNISYLTEGEVGNQIFKLEWRNVGFSEEVESEGSSFINIQLWLYEADGRIEYHYGENFFENPIDLENSSILIGLVGNFNTVLETFDEFILLEGDPTDPSVMYLDQYGYEYYDEFTLDSFPPNSTVYTFNNSSVSTEDIRQLSSEFEVRPNPALDIISLKTTIDINRIRSVSIYNSSGALIKVVESNYDQIQITNFVPGIYNLSILTDKGFAAKRFVKI